MVKKTMMLTTTIAVMVETTASSTVEDIGGDGGRDKVDNDGHVVVVVVVAVVVIRTSAMIRMVNVQSNDAGEEESGFRNAMQRIKIMNLITLVFVAETVENETKLETEYKVKINFHQVANHFLSGYRETSIITQNTHTQIFK